MASASIDCFIIWSRSSDHRVIASYVITDVDGELIAIVLSTDQIETMGLM